MKRRAISAIAMAAFLLATVGCKDPADPVAGIVVTPSFTPGTGTYSAAAPVVISTATAGASIRYTTDGSTPSSSYGREYDGVPIDVSSSVTLKAVAYLEGWTDSDVGSAEYTLAGTVAAPTFTPGGGTYSVAQTVVIASATSGVTIHYTTDGSAPTEQYGTVYSGVPVAVATSRTFKAVAFKTGLAPSMVASVDYTITGTTANPIFTPGGGTYADTQSVTIRSTTAGAAIRYTTDGNFPTPTTGIVYSDLSPISITQTTTLRAIAYTAGLNDSTVSSATYTFGGTVANLSFSPIQGGYAGAQSVGIATTTVGASIRYTLDGSTPTGSYGTPYGGPVPITETTNIRAIAYKTGWIDSAIAAGTWSIALDSTGNVGQWTSLALSGTDVLVSCYDVTNLDLKMVTGASGGTSWAPATKVDWPNSVGQYSSIAVAGTKIGISYYDATAGDLRFAYSTNGGAAWTRRTVDGAATNVGQWTSLAMSGTWTVISYYDVTGSDLKVAWSADGGDTWTAGSVDTTGNVGQYSAIALNGDNVYVSYYDTAGSGDLKFSRAPNPAGPWTSATIDAGAGGNVGQYTSLKHDAGTSTIWVSYYDVTTSSLKVASSVDGGAIWVPLAVPVDSLGSVGQWSSLAVAGTTLCVSYYEDYAYSVKVALSADSGLSWSISTPDTEGVGQYTAVALSGSDIWVSYYDLTNLDLKLAHSPDSGGSWSLY